MPEVIIAYGVASISCGIAAMAIVLLLIYAELRKLNSNLHAHHD